MEKKVIMQVKLESELCLGSLHREEHKKLRTYSSCVQTLMQFSKKVKFQCISSLFHSSSCINISGNINQPSGQNSTLCSMT